MSVTPGRILGALAGAAAIVIVVLGLAFGLHPGGFASRPSPSPTVSPSSSASPSAGTAPGPSSTTGRPAAGALVDQAGMFPGGGLWAIKSTTLWISPDGGMTWSTGTIQTSPTLSSPPSTLVDVLDAEHVWTLTGDDFGTGVSADMTGTKDAITQDRLALTVNRSTDGGRTWSRTVIDGNYPGSIQALHFVDATQGYLVISPGRFDLTGSTVLRTADGGLTWQVAGTDGWLGTILAAPDASTIWAASAGDAGPVERRIFAVSRDSGRTWTDVALPGVQALLGQWVQFAQAPIFIGSTGIVLVTPNDGSGISAIDRSDDGGKTWIRVATTGSPSLAVLGQASWLRAGATPGVLEATSDAGATWHQLATTGLPAASTITWLGFSDSNHGALTAATGLAATSGLYVTQDGGTSWRLADFSTATSPSTGAGLTLRPVPAAQFGGVELSRVVAIPDGYLAIGTPYGGTPPLAQAPGQPSLWRSSDGLSWTRLPDDPAFAALKTDWVDVIASVTHAGASSLIAVGSSNNGDSSASDAAAWISTDGITWTRAVVEDASDAAMNDVTAMPGGFVAVGIDGHTSGGTQMIGSRGAAVWTSPDGSHWSRVPAEAAFAGAEMTRVVQAGSNVIATGVDVPTGAGTVNPPIWSSTDGRTWVRATATTTFPPDSYAIDGVIGTGSEFLAAGSEELGDRRFEWSSVDGQHWKRSELALSTLGGPAPILVGLAKAGLGFVLFGSVRTSGVAETVVVWESTDGIAWKSIAIQPQLDGTGLLSAVSGPAGVLVLGTDQANATTLWLATP